MKKYIAIVSVLILFLACKNNTAVISVNLGKSKNVTPIVYGWHYEEIGMIGEGGLYAEMVRNRSLEEANMPSGLKVVNGLYEGIPNPNANKNKLVYSIDPLIGWEKFPKESPFISLRRANEMPLNKKNLHSLHIKLNKESDDHTGVINNGFFGMNLIRGNSYELTFYARAEDFTGKLSVVLIDSLGNKVSSSYQAASLSDKWQLHETTLNVTAATENGRLLFSPSSSGSVFLDVVSLFPDDTWDNGKSIFREDILQNLKDFAPEFFRFPGGCLVHGVNEETMYHWKETIGDISERPGGWSKWKPNYRTDGLGYHEFYELCEYLECDAMYVVPSGLVCTGWVFESDKKDDHFHPDINVQEYVQDALDAIEYAIGSVDSKWGSIRAKNGHPKPFPLKYIEIGNEDFGPHYYENYDIFYRAIHKQYPELKIIANSIIGKTKDRDKKRERISEFKDVSTIKIFDEHFYKDVPWVIENYFKFDAYERPGPDMFIGELGIRGQHPTDVLGEAVFMMSMERNGDLNPMMADRPLMRNWTFVKGGGNPLYYHTNSTSFKTFNYYMAKLFRDNKIDIWYESNYQLDEKDVEMNTEYLFTSFGKDSESGEIIIKVVNLSSDSKTATISVGSEPIKSRASIVTLANNFKRNTPDQPFAVVPVTSEIDFSISEAYQFEPKSLTIFRIKLP